MAHLNTATANNFVADGGPNGKFPHTGPVSYGYGARSYTAALKGLELKDAKGRNRMFKTPEAARAAIIEAAGA